MANTLTNLIPDVYAALDVVSRELVGFIPSVYRDSRADRVAYNQTLRVPVAPANGAGGDITPAMSLPSAANQTISNATIALSKQRYFPFSWSGEESYAMDAGPGYLSLKQAQIAQAIRAACNEIESDLATGAYKAASRAYGTAGTTPFASDLSDTANLRKILDDNGAPLSDRSVIINTTAGAKLRTLAQLTKANEAADSSMLRQGTLLDVHGFMIRESAQLSTVTKGTGASYLVNNASGYAVGDTAITLDTGSGTILAGDVITFAGDTNKYVVKTALTANVVTIAAPGLRATLADNTAVTVGNNFTPNVGFSRNAIVLATRLPAIPMEGDMAIDREVVTDPRSGLSFEVAVYPGYRMNTYHLSVVWGYSVIKPEHTAILLG
jgi:hypothetical protein